MVGPILPAGPAFKTLLWSQYCSPWPNHVCLLHKSLYGWEPRLISLALLEFGFMCSVKVYGLEFGLNSGLVLS